METLVVDKKVKEIFTWAISESDYDNAVKMYKENTYDGEHEFVGNLRFGNVCFDFIVRPYDEAPMLTADMYVFGVDTGYATTEDGTPYSYEDGFDFNEPWMYELSFDEFKELAQKMAFDFFSIKQRR